MQKSEGKCEGSNNISVVLENSDLVAVSALEPSPNSAALEQALKSMLARMIQSSSAANSKEREWVSGLPFLRRAIRCPLLLTTQ
jgi:hypothetical protein